METNVLFGVLHRHPKKEAELGLDDQHVIVDRKDWEQCQAEGLVEENALLRERLNKLQNTLAMIVEQMKFDKGYTL
jgi:hypothetical protein